MFYFMENKYCISSELLKKLDDAIKDIGNMNPWQYVIDSAKEKLPKMEVEEYRDDKGNLYAFSVK